MSRSRRLLRSPSSLALTDGPAAPWGGLRTLVGGWGDSFAPTRKDPKRVWEACPREGGSREN